MRVVCVVVYVRSETTVVQPKTCLSAILTDLPPLCDLLGGERLGLAGLVVQREEGEVREAVSDRDGGHAVYG